ncbi:MAG: hypothetical protein K2Q25_13235 [Mycobacteriaceae bacterium]|nr:hypothetical protein [Mycobacteriaceae bacterium]
MWAALLSLFALAVSGCGTGQLSQTTSQVPAINGANVTFNNVALRDVRIQANQTGDFLRPGRTVELVLVAVNQSPNIIDRLVSISSDIGTVAITGNPQLPASGLLFVGSAHRPGASAVDTVENATKAKATVTLTKPITNGLTYNFTFAFDKAGKGSLLVPISAGQAPPTN